MKLLHLFSFLLLLTNSCHKNGGESEYKIISGQIIPASQLDAVIWVSAVELDGDGGGKLVEQCTGTFISPRLLLTAAHCFDEIKDEDKRKKMQLMALRQEDWKTKEELQKIFNEEKSYEGRPPVLASDEENGRYMLYTTLAFSKAVHLHPDYSLAQKEELSQKFKEATTASEKKTLMEKWNYEFHGSDLAVIEFGEDVFEGTPLELAAADPMVGEKVQLVGFGYNSLAEKVGSGIKRWGQDVISEVKTHMLVTYGDVLYQLDPEAGETSTAGGDSGGPLLNSENKIQGVLSLGQKVWWDGQIQNRSIYVKTTSEKSQAFLKGFLE